MRSSLLAVLFLALTFSAFSFSACAQRRQPVQTTHTDGNPAHYDLSAYPASSAKVEKSDQQWLGTLSSESYQILRRAGTERAFTGALLENHEQGIFKCAGCGNPLFASQTEFESGTGWPSFYEPIEPARVEEKTDESFGMARTEVLCARCGGHLGHVFDDGPAPTGLRYCMNSAALAFDKK